MYKSILLSIELFLFLVLNSESSEMKVVSSSPNATKPKFCTIFNETFVQSLKKFFFFFLIFSRCVLKYFFTIFGCFYLLCSIFPPPTIILCFLFIDVNYLDYSCSYGANTVVIIVSGMKYDINIIVNMNYSYYYYL